MKVEWRTILGASVFLGATGVVYWALKNHPTEASGVVMLIFGFAAYGMLFGYLLLQYMRRHRSPAPRTASTPPTPTAKGSSATSPTRPSGRRGWGSAWSSPSSA